MTSTQESAFGPFEEHLRDALKINRTRAPLYSKLTQGESQSISKWLILSESLSLPFSKIPDQWAQRFNAKGIPIGKEEFMPMTGISEFRDQYPFTPEPLSEYRPKSGTRIALGILIAYLKHGLQGASQMVKLELKSLEYPRAYHVMLRHVLESMLRVAYLAPLHEKLRIERGIKSSTLPLSKYLFLSHLSALQFSTWIDRKASPIQAKGVPILHQDVPSIPLQSEFYRALQ